MNWRQLTSLNDLESLIIESQSKSILIFKHSTRCGVSRFALRDLEKNWDDVAEQKIIPYLLDLLSHRDVSAEIEKRFGVLHQSPQILLIRNGKCFYSATHSDIDYREIIEKAKE